MENIYALVKVFLRPSFKYLTLFVVTLILTASASNAQVVCALGQSVQTSAAFPAPASVVTTTVDPTWANVAPNTISKLQVTGGNLDGHPYPAQQPDYGAQFRSKWDATYLYIFVQVTDNTINPDQNTGGNAQFYNNDGVEVFVSGNDNTGTSYGNFDAQYGFSHLSAGATNNSNVTLGAHGGSVTKTGVIYSTIPIASQPFGSGGAGYDVEIAIPWTALGIGTPGMDQNLGFDIEIDDNDFTFNPPNDPGGGYRDSQIAWNSPTSGGSSGQDYGDPQNFATFPLTAPPTAPATGAAQTICLGNTATLNGNVAVIGTGTWAGVSGPNTATSQLSSTTINNPVFTPTGGAGTYVFSWSISNAPCSPTTIFPSKNDTVNVTALPTLTLTTGNASQTVCSGTGIGAIKFTVAGGATGATVSATLPPGVSGAFAAGVFTISGTPTTAVGSPFNYTVTTTGASCTEATQTGTITVNPIPTIALSSAAGTDAQTVCANTAITSITYLVGGAATGATVSALPAGVTGAFAGSTFTISGAPTTAVGSPFSYTVTTSGGLCGTVNKVGTITVHPVPTIALSSAAGTDAQTVCANTAITSITYLVGGAATGATVSALPAGVTGVFAGSTFTISGTPTTAVGSPFSYTVTTSGGLCGTVNKTGTITVNPLLVPVVSCGTSTTTSVQFTWPGVAGATGYSVSYKINSGGATAPAAGTSPFTVSALLPGDVVTLSVTPTGPPAPTGCFAVGIDSCVASNCTPSTVTVPANITVCAGGIVAATAFTSTPVGATYTWTNSAGLTIGLAATGVGNVPSFTATNATSSPITATISVTPTIAPCPGTASSYTITVNPVSTITLTSGSATPTVCSGTAITPIVYTIGGGATGAALTGTLPPGVTGSIAGSTFTISGTPTSAAGSPFNYTVTTTGSSCTEVSLSGTITVNPLLAPTVSCGITTTSSVQFTWPGVVGATGYNLSYTINGAGAIPTTGTSPYVVSALSPGDIVAITVTPTGPPPPAGCFAQGIDSCTANTCTPSTVTVPANITVCNGGTVAATAFTSTPVGATFAWSAAGAAIGLAPTSGTGNVPSFTATNVTSSPITVTITVTPAIGPCTGTANTYTITVNPLSTITLTSGSATPTVCSGTAITPIVYTIGGGATGVALTGTLPPGVTGSIAGSTFTISGTPTSAAGSPFNYTVTTTGSSCTEVSLSGTITVNPLLTPTVSCGITTTSSVQFTWPGVAGATGYNLNYTINSGGAVPTTGTSPFVVSALSPGDIVAITVTPTGPPPPAGCFAQGIDSCTANTCTPSTVTVPANITVCNGGTVAATAFTSTPVGATYTWTNSVGLAIGLASSGVGDVPSFTATNATTSPITTTITVTPSVGPCAGTASSYTITVNPLSTITLTSGSATPTVCSGTAITPIVYTIGGGATGVALTGTLPPGVTGSIAGSTFTISGTPTSAAGSPFNYTVTTTGSSCTEVSLSGTITVNPLLAPTVSCGITTTSSVQFTWPGVVGATGYNLSYTINGAGAIPTTGTSPFVVSALSPGDIVAITVTPTGPPPPAGCFAQGIDSCTANTCTPSTVTVPANITVCNGGTVAATAFASTPVGATYTWTNSDPTIGIALSGSGDIASFTATNATSSPVTATITVTPSITPCTGTANTYTITVDPDATIALSSAAGTNVQSTCINVALAAPITYAIGGSGTGATVVGLPAGVTGSFAAGVFTISGAPTTTAGSPFGYTVTTTGPCTSHSLSGTITVNPDAAITLSSAVGTDAQSVCINTALITPITYAISGGGTGATVAGLPTGITGSFSGGTFTISGTPTVAGPLTYTVTTTGTCAQNSLSGTITVNPDATISLSSGFGTDNQSTCINTALATPITYAIGGGGTGAIVTALPAGVTGSFAAGVFTISGTPTTSAGSPFGYTVTTTGTCVQQSLSGTITVNPDASINLSSAIGTDAQSICVNTSITPITYAIGGGGTGAVVTALPTGVTGSFSGGVFTISGTPTTSAGSPFNYTVTTTGGSCIENSLTGTITVNPDATISLSSGFGTDSQSVCVNTAITSITYAIGGGGTGAIVTALPAGVNGSFAAGVFTISGTPTTSIGSPFGYTVTTTGTCIQQNVSGMITVNPDASITLSSAAGTDNQSTCINVALVTPITYAIGGGGTGATVTGLPAGVTGSFSGGVFTISGTPTTTTGSPFGYTVTTTGTCAQNSLSGTITVNPDATISLSSGFGTDNQSTCINTPLSTPITYAIGGGGTGATVTVLPAGVTGSFAAGVFTISGAPTTAAGSPFSYTVTTTGTCVQQSLSGTITVNANATIALSSAVGTDNQSTCINVALATPITYTTSGATGATATGLPAGVTGSYSGGVFTITGTPTTTAGSPFTYTVTTTGTCVQSTISGTITVNPDATISLSSGFGTDNQSTCINTPLATPITYAIGGGGTGAFATGLPTGVTGSYSGGVFTISGAPTTTTGSPFSYTVTTTGTCVQQSLSGTITVNPDATITLSSVAGSDAQSLCINTPLLTSITYAIGGGGTGAIVAGLPAGVTGSYGGGVFTITGTPTTTAGSPFTYTVTTTGTCAQNNLSGTITVNPDATLSLSSGFGTDAQSLCINTPLPSSITYAVGGGGTGATVTTLPAGVTSSYSGGVFTISGIPTATGTFSYTVTTTGTCVQQSLPGTITVNPDATIALSSAAGTDNQSLCINTPLVSSITYAIGGGGTGATALGLPAGVTGSYSGGVFTITGTPTTTAGSPFTYTVTTTGTCVQHNLSGTITVTPDATISLTSAFGTDAQGICINTVLTPITYAIGGGGTNAILTGTLPTGVTGSYSGGVFTISGTPTTTAGSPYTYTVTTTGTCVQHNLSGTITVNPDATISLSSSAGSDAQTLCVNTVLLTPITYAIGGGGTGATVSGLPAGITGNYSAGVFTISGTPTATGSFNYLVTTTGTCVQHSLSGNITVNPDATIALSSAVGTDGQSLCINTAITPITYAIGGGGTGGTVAGLPAGVTGNYSGGVFTISGSPTTTVGSPFNYTVTTTGTCVQHNLQGTIAVNPDATITLSSAAGSDDQSVCVNTALPMNITYAIGGGGTGAIVDGLPPGVTGIFIAGTFTISGTPTTTVGSPFNYTVTTTGTCIQHNLTGTITVNPEPTVATVPQSACAPATVDLTLPDVTSGSTPSGLAFTYWDDPAATVAITDPSAISASATYYIKGITPEGCSDIASVAVVVNPFVPAPSVIPDNECQFTPASALTVNSAPANSIPYWYIVATGGTPDSSVIPPTDIAQVLTYYVGVQDTITHCFSPREIQTVTVTAKPNAGIENDNPTQLNAGSSINLSSNATSTDDVEWSASTDGYSTIFSTDPSKTVTPPFNPNDKVDSIGVDPTHTSDTTIYRLILTSTENTNCKDTAEVTVIVRQILIIPNIFSPNGNSKFDKWYIGNIEQYPQARVSIFNRYGQFIFESPEGYPTPWDGTYHGEPLAVGTYFYIITTAPGAAPLSGPISIVR